MLTLAQGTMGGLLAWLHENWEILLLLLTWGGIAVAWIERRQAWARKEFLSQVNFSINYLQDNQLRMRTLLEMPTEEVWINPHGIDRVQAAARRTTPDNPFVLLKKDEDTAFLNRAVLNVLSERFAEAYLAASMGRPVRSAQYVFAITCENYEQMRTRKLRVLVVERNTLERDFDPDRQPEEGIGLEQPHHRDRLTTLQSMHRLMRQQEPAPGGVLETVELGLVGA